MAKVKGLGRGLDSLLGGDLDDVISSSDVRATLRLDQLVAGKYQPRSVMDEEALRSLANSIKSHGVIQPISVREINGGQYEIIAGERRFRASQIAGLDEMPVIIRESEDESALEIALIENMQREDLNPLEEAQGIKRLIDEFDKTHEEAAGVVGRSRAAVSNLLRLLTLSDPVQELLMQSRLDMGHARALVGLPGAHQVIIAERIIKDQLSVREAEKIVRSFNAEDMQQGNAPKPTAEVSQDIKKLEETLSDQLGAVVNIKSTAKGGGTLKIWKLRACYVHCMIRVICWQSRFQSN